MHLVKKTVLSVVTAAFLAGGLGACGKSGDTPGERLDDALAKTGDAVKDAGEAIKPK